MITRKGIAAFFALGVISLAGLGEGPVAPQPLQLLIPLYSCPSDAGGALWRAVVDAASQVKITVIWGIICEEDDYRTALGALGAAGVRRLAYVATSDSTRPLTEVEAEIDFYHGFPIDGIFLDEVSHEPPAWKYNEALIAYVRGLRKTGTVILNSPYPDAAFVRGTSADAVVVFEGAYADWLDFDIRYPGIPPARLAALVHGTPRVALTRVMKLAAARGIGLLFVTDRGWDLLPSYLREEVRMLGKTKRR